MLNLRPGWVFDAANYPPSMVGASFDAQGTISMAKGNLAACLAVTLVHEGGYSDHPRDPGGATNMGITHGVLAESRGVRSVTKADVRALSRAEATAIYDARYWRLVKGDDLPFGVDLATFDYGVNSGVGRAARYLQMCVGEPQDGRIGPSTLTAVLIHGDKKALIQNLCAKRMSFLRGISTFDAFGKGWTRRVADVEAKAVAMWLTKGLAGHGVDARTELNEEAGKAAGKSEKQAKSAGGSVTGGVGLPAGDAVLNGSMNWKLAAVTVVVGLLVGGALYLKARWNHERAKAYEAAAVGR